MLYYKIIDSPIGKIIIATNGRAITALHIQGTFFQKNVLNAVSTIDHGRTLSYGDIARQIGKPKAVRAVGTAVGRNPICLLIPCHRVLTGTGALGGYVAGIERKEYLHAHERNTIKV